MALLYKKFAFLVGKNPLKTLIRFAFLKCQDVKTERIG